MKESERNFAFHDWLNADNGYAILREYDLNGMPMEYWLVRGMFEKKQDDDGYYADNIEYIFSSKHEKKVYDRYISLKPNLNIMDIRESLQNLTIPQLESLLPSYYQLAIERRIAELKALEEKPKENAVTKTKRKSKKTTTKRNRSRDLS